MCCRRQNGMMKEARGFCTQASVHVCVCVFDTSPRYHKQQSASNKPDVTCCDVSCLLWHDVIYSEVVKLIDRIGYFCCQLFHGLHRK